MFGRRGLGFRSVAMSAAVSLAIASSSAFATNRSYVGGAGTGNWNTSSNWSPTGQPAQFDNAFIATNDALARTVTFTPAVPAIYGDVFVSNDGTGTSRLLNQGGAFQSETLTVARNGIYGQEQASASTVLHDVLLSQNGRISVGNGSFNTVNFTQIGGTIEFGRYNVSGFYSMQNGAMNASLVNTGTFDYVGGTSNGAGSIENHGTFIYRNQTGSFLTNIENRGTIILSADTTTFRSLRNHVAMFIGGQSRLTTTDNLVGIAQTNGTFFMSGDSRVITGRVWLDGGSWNQFGGQVDAMNINIGRVGGGESIYQLGTGTVNVLSAWVGEQNSSGAIVQSGGRFTADAVTLGNQHAPGATSNSTGRYDLSAGTLQTEKLIVGGRGSASGTFTQSGGNARVSKLIINDEAASKGILRITGGQFGAEDNGSTPIVNHGQIDVTGGWANFAPIEGTGSITVSGNGQLNADRVRLNSVRVSDNGKLLTHFTTSKLNQLSFDESGGAVHGQWDLHDGALVLDHNGTSPIASVKRWVKSGHAGGSWTGNGFMLTEAAIAPLPQYLAIGYVEASRLLGASGGIFDGVQTDGSAVLVKSTWYGDTDLNDIINFDDYARLDAGFNNHGDEWFEGDFNYDGVVNFDDYALIDYAFGVQAAGVVAKSAVPEPATMLTSTLAMIATSLRRRRVQ